jgi:hypothetical protein
LRGHTDAPRWARPRRTAAAHSGDIGINFKIEFTRETRGKLISTMAMMSENEKDRLPNSREGDSAPENETKEFVNVNLVHETLYYSVVITFSPFSILLPHSARP